VAEDEKAAVSSKFTWEEEGEGEERLPAAT